MLLSFVLISAFSLTELEAHLAEGGPKERLEKLLAQKKLPLRVLRARLSDRGRVRRSEGCIVEDVLLIDEALKVLFDKRSPAEQDILQLDILRGPQMRFQGRMIKRKPHDPQVEAAILELAKRGDQGAIDSVVRHYKDRYAQQLRSFLLDKKTRSAALSALRDAAIPSLFDVLISLELGEGERVHQLIAIAAYKNDRAAHFLNGTFDERGAHRGLNAALETHPSPAFETLGWRLAGVGEIGPAGVAALLSADPGRFYALLPRLFAGARSQPILLTALLETLDRHPETAERDGLLVAVLQRANVHQIVPIASAIRRLKPEGALKRLLEIAEHDTNPNMYVEASKTLLAYQRRGLRARVSEISKARRARGVEHAYLMWGIEALEDLVLKAK